MTDPRLDQAPLVATFAEALQPVVDVVALWAGGSLAAGDYRPGISDLDLAAVLRTPAGPEQEAALTGVHQALMVDDPAADKLHCFYLPQDGLGDPADEQLNWAHRELYRRPFTVVARAELLRGGITVLGTPPVELLAPVDAATLRAAARAELTGYWAGAVGKPGLWLQDVYVDLGLLTLARVEATVTEDRLITKQEALGRLGRFDVPRWLVEEMTARRAGRPVDLTVADRARRAVTARQIVAHGIARYGTMDW